MATRKIKWYNSKWFYYSIILITIIIIYLLVKNTVSQTNIAKHLKGQNEELLREGWKKDRVIDSLMIQKNKVKVIREKVSIASEEELIKKLQKELQDLRKKEVVIDTITPEKLNIYLNNIINR